LKPQALQDEISEEDGSYAQSVASGGTQQRAEEPNDSAQWHQYYGKIRAAQLNGVPTSLAETTIGPPPVSSRLPATQPSGYKCRDCGYVSKSSDDDAFEHTKTKLHTKGFDLVKQQ